MTTIISATNRKDSKSLAVANYYHHKLEEKGYPTRLLPLTELPDNLIATDLYGKRSNEFHPIQEMILDTDKFLFVIPEYNGSFPGVLKTFIDSCKFPESFRGKKAALVGVSSGKYGNIRGLEHFSGICLYIGMQVMPLRIHIPSLNNELNDKDHFFKDDTVKFVNQQIDQFIDF